MTKSCSADSEEEAPEPIAVAPAPDDLADDWASLAPEATDAKQLPAAAPSSTRTETSFHHVPSFGALSERSQQSTDSAVTHLESSTQLRGPFSDGGGLPSPSSGAPATDDWELVHDDAANDTGHSEAESLGGMTPPLLVTCEDRGGDVFIPIQQQVLPHGADAGQRSGLEGSFLDRSDLEASGHVVSLDAEQDDAQRMHAYAGRLTNAEQDGAQRMHACVGGSADAEGVVRGEGVAREDGGLKRVGSDREVELDLFGCAFQ